jgi:catechol O-methyltransferase
MARSVSRPTVVAFAAVAAVSFAALFGWLPPGLIPLPRWLLWMLALTCSGLAVHELMGRPVPFLRWSFIRMALGMKKLLTDWQVGDGREEACARHVLAHAAPGDIDAAIAAIDEFAYDQAFLINVGDEKGVLLDDALRRVQPRRVLEVGAYVGYSALRMARLLPEGGHIYSVEYSMANAGIARRIVEHAGAQDRITFVVGTLGDEGKTLEKLRSEHGFAAGNLDLVFLDHDKTCYLPDLQRILDAGWLHSGSVVVADNVGFPGAPDYRAFMEAEEGRRFRTQAHQTHAEYQSVIPDVVLESTVIG